MCVGTSCHPTPARRKKNGHINSKSDENNLVTIKIRKFEDQFGRTKQKDFLEKY